MKLYSVLTNTVAGLSLASVAIDSHKMAKNNANATLVKGTTDDLMEDIIASSKLNYESEKYAEIKNDVLKYKMSHNYKDVFYKTKGYAKGFTLGLAHNFPTVLCSVITLVAKKRPLKIAGAIGVGASVLWSFIKNGTNLLEKNDYMKY